MTDNVNHPAHYTIGFEYRSPECFDFTQHMSFCRGNAFKYVWRCGLKGNKDKWIEDLKKAQWYLSTKYEVRNDTDAIESLFLLLKPENSHKYKALRLIAIGFYDAAKKEINQMIEEIEMWCGK